MDTHPDYSLLAEHSTFSRLTVVHRSPRQSIFQQATEADNVSAEMAYHYVAQFEQPITNVPYDEYTIISLPDVISYLPVNSIFSFIPTILSTSPDFRFVRVNAKRASLNISFDNITVLDRELLEKQANVKTYTTPKQDLITTIYPGLTEQEALAKRGTIQKKH